MIMKNTLSTERTIYLVSFMGVQQHFIFEEIPEVLGNLIQEHGKNGINFISRFDQSKSKFKKLSKAEIKQFFGWDTHSILQLQYKNYIK